jgi:DNA modification methylase
MLNTREHVQFGVSSSMPNRVIQGDNLPVLECWQDRALDTVYLDPPFGTGTTKRSSARTRYEDPLADPEVFVTWLTPRLVHARRALRDTGSLFVHLDYRAVHYVKVALDKLFGRKNFINEIVWCYSVGGRSRRSFGKKHDTILWYGKSSDYAFYPDSVRVARKPSSHMRVVLDDDGAPVQEKTDRRTGRVYRYPLDQGKVPEDWWIDIETLNHSDRERMGWPTQKPERLLERLILSTTQPGDVVADWFAGSGTTAAVAQNLGRHFVIGDAEPQAIECARRRLTALGATMAEQGQTVPDILFECWVKEAA